MATAEEIAHSADNNSEPPADYTPVERALWLARAGQWHPAHDLCQDLPNPGGAWIHAWLHREEGDYGNACYWYSAAGKPAPPEDADLSREWFQIASALVDFV